MKQISDTDIGYAYNRSPFVDKKNLQKLAKQYGEGKSVGYLGLFWNVSPYSIRYRLEKLGLYTKKKYQIKI